MSDEQRSAISYFDRAIGALDGLPDVVKSKDTTMRVIPTFGIGTYTYIVKTYRRREEGDTIFLEVASEGNITRIVIPPAIADVIARQRDQLTTKSRSRASKRVMEDRMARGEKPGFMKRQTS